MLSKTILVQALALAFGSLVNAQAITISSFDDVAKAKAGYTAITINAMAVPGGKTLDLTGLKAGTVVTFTGTTTFAYAAWEGPLVSVSGTDIVVQGSGTLDGNGAKYWDGQGGSGGVDKPKFFSAHKMIGKSKITGITVLNSPVQVWSINDSDGLAISDVTLNNKAGDALAKNTDAFDIGSIDGLTITGATIYNQDDCTAVNSGTNIVISNMYCSGGHGLSIGSVGGRSDNTVQNVVFKDSTVVKSAYGVRIKTNVGTTGLVDTVTYSNITLVDITKYGIILEQDYNGGDAKGTPDNGVPITNLHLTGVKGNVVGGMNYYFNCGSGSCGAWTFTGVSVTGGSKTPFCNYTPSGFSCSSGSTGSAATTTKAAATTLQTTTKAATTLQTTTKAAATTTTTIKVTTTTVKTAATTTSTKAATTTTTKAATTTAASSCSAAKYAQCGGSGFTGCTTCASGSTCKFSSEWYSQCI